VLLAVAILHHHRGRPVAQARVGAVGALRAHVHGHRDRRLQTPLGAIDAGAEVVGAIDDDLGGVGGGRGADVGDEIGDGEVDFVADGRDTGTGHAQIARASASSLNA
jgi:hypothetical protein